MGIFVNSVKFLINTLNLSNFFLFFFPRKMNGVLEILTGLNGKFY
jgi:hypothetical protein